MEAIIVYEAENGYIVGSVEQLDSVLGEVEIMHTQVDVISTLREWFKRNEEEDE